MNCVVDQRGNRFAIGIDGLQHAHSAIVQIGSVIVVGDLATRLVRGDFQPRRSKLVQRLVDRLGCFLTNEVHIVQVPRMAAAAVGKGIAIGRAVRVRGTDQDVLFRNPRHTNPHSIAQHRGEPQEIQSDDRDSCLAVLKDDRPRGELTLFLLRISRGPQSPGDRQERIGRDDPSASACFELSMRDRAVEQKNNHQQDV